MAQITFNIPDSKLQRIIAAMVGLYPIPKNKNEEPLFTPGEWAKEAVRRLVISDVCKWERRKASIVASEAIEKDNNLLN